MDLMMKTLHAHKKRGFVALIAVIIVSTVLILGIGILNITLREFKLANVERESLKALYAADSGLDCAFHYDMVDYTGAGNAAGNFASPLYPSTRQPSGNSIECFGNIINITYDDTNPNVYITDLGNIQISDNNTCVRVIISKTKISDSQESTEIRALGYNTPCISDSDRRVQRVLKLDWGAR